MFSYLGCAEGKAQLEGSFIGSGKCFKSLALNNQDCISFCASQGKIYSVKHKFLCFALKHNC